MLRGASTRQLSAGTYLDAGFRGAVLDEFLRRRNGAVAPAFSTDAVPVLRHALNARRHQVIRDAVLTGVLLLFLVLEFRVLLGVLALSLVLLLVLRSGRALLHGRLVAAGVLLIPALITLFISLILLESGSGLIASIVGSDDSAGAWIRQVGGVLVVVLGAAWTTIVVERLVNRQTILDHLMPDTYRPGADPTEPRRYRRRLAQIAQAQTGNVTYYPPDAPDHPFVGSGPVLHSWSQVVPLNRSEAGTGANPTTANLSNADLRDSLARALAELDGIDARTEVSVQDRLVTPAVTRTGDPRYDPAERRFRHRLSPADLEQLSEAEESGTRRYLCVRMAPGGGDHEIWVFVDGHVRARTLHLELVATGLGPVRARYREIDQYPATGPGVVLRTAVGALPDLPGLLLRAPLHLLLGLTGRQTTTLTLDALRRLTASPGLGARASVRELGTDLDGENLMAGLTVQRQVHLVEQQVLESVAASLRAAGLEDGEFRRQAQNAIDRNGR